MFSLQQGACGSSYHIEIVARVVGCNSFPIISQVSRKSRVNAAVGEGDVIGNRVNIRQALSYALLLRFSTAVVVAFMWGGVCLYVFTQDVNIYACIVQYGVNEKKNYKSAVGCCLWRNSGELECCLLLLVSVGCELISTRSAEEVTTRHTQCRYRRYRHSHDVVGVAMYDN